MKVTTLHFRSPISQKYRVLRELTGAIGACLTSPTGGPLCEVGHACPEMGASGRSENPQFIRRCPPLPDELRVFVFCEILFDRKFNCGLLEVVAHEMRHDFTNRRRHFG